ncbi:HTH_Tnp_Tc3_2 domain-containing protein [Trichonephila clavipes]|nr:HTH_Tnp_Tc3_2 domain-containing protein [Trichonephila clavipes]
MSSITRCSGLSRQRGYSTSRMASARSPDLNSIENVWMLLGGKFLVETILQQKRTPSPVHSQRNEINCLNSCWIMLCKVDGVNSIPRIHGWWTKTSDRANYKGQLALTVYEEIRLGRIVRSQRSQTVAQNTTQLNDSASRIVSKRTKQSSLHRMGFGNSRPTRVPLLNARHWGARLILARGNRDWGVEDRK